MNYLSIKEACEYLSISLATGRNWIKLGKLIPTETREKTPYFSPEYLSALKNDIQSGANASLKSRRNKNYVSGNGIYRSYINPKSDNHAAVSELLDLIDSSDLVLNDEVIQILIAECAIQLICQSFQINYQPSISLLQQYLDGTLDLLQSSSFIEDLLTSKDHAKSLLHEYADLFKICYHYEPTEDVLGLLYISLKNIGARKATGSYYTPTHIVQQLIECLTISTNRFQNLRILDPSCGTGNFLLQLPDGVSANQIFAQDIDELSIKITRINMLLKFHLTDTTVLYKNITVSNYLFASDTRTYDCILGNPPWGYHFHEKEIAFLKSHFQCATNKNIESYDVFIEQSLRRLSTNGHLSFVLPEAILNVKTHQPIRQQILQTTSIASLAFLGNAFDQVQCPSIILELKNTKQPLTTLGMRVTTGADCFTIQQERALSSDIFSFTSTDEEYRILQKILEPEHKTTLLHQADFALGIVTGNNKEFIKNTPAKDYEIILKGSDICKFHINETGNYIHFQPDHFQQSAPAAYYRAPEKLLYRFICNQLVFAYDDKQSLSLNSCNIVIPRIEYLSIKYILAVLNSSAAQFVFRKQFNSVKVLRSHIEQIPIPVVSSRQQNEICQLVNQLINETNPSRIKAVYAKLDKEVAGLFHLSDTEYALIQKVSAGQNLFLY